MKGDITFGLDLGSDSLKTGFVIECDAMRFRYGKLAVSYFDDKFPAYAYYAEDTKKWVFGEDIFCENNDYECIVRVKDLLMLNDGTMSSPYHEKNYQYPKFCPRFIEERSRFATEKTFVCGTAPKAVVEQFFKAYFTLFFNPAIVQMLQIIPDTSYHNLLGARAVIAVPDNAVDEYATELVRLASLDGFLNIKADKFKTRRVSETAALFAVNANKLRGEERALVADVGESGLTLSVVDGINLEEYLDVWSVGGANIDQDVYNFVKEEIEKKHNKGSLNKNEPHEKSDPLGTYYQLFNLELRIKNAKATLSTKGSKWTRVEVEGAATEQVPLTLDSFFEATKPTIKRISDLITVAANKAKVLKIILSGGAAQTRGLKTIIAENNPKRMVVVYDDDGRTVATDIFDVYDRGTEFAPAIGAAFFATRKFKGISRAPRSYGVGAVDNAGTQLCSLIVKKNTKLPVTETRRFYTRAEFANTAQTKLYSTTSTTDVMFENDAHIAGLISQGILSLKDKGCEIRFLRKVLREHPIILEIAIDENGLGEVRAYDGKTNERIGWSGENGTTFSTSADRGGGPQ